MANASGVGRGGVLGARAGLAPTNNHPLTHPPCLLVKKSSPPPHFNLPPTPPSGSLGTHSGSLHALPFPGIRIKFFSFCLVEHSYADYCLTYYSNNINTYYMYCADGCCGYSHDRECCNKIKYVYFSTSNRF